MHEILIRLEIHDSREPVIFNDDVYRVCLNQNQYLSLHKAHAIVLEDR